MHKSIQVGYTVKFDHRKFNNVLKLWQARQSTHSEPKLLKTCCFDFHGYELSFIAIKLFFNYYLKWTLSFQMDDE